MVGRPKTSLVHIGLQLRAPLKDYICPEDRVSDVDSCGWPGPLVGGSFSDCLCLVLRALAVDARTCTHVGTHPHQDTQHAMGWRTHSLLGCQAVGWLGPWACSGLIPPLYTPPHTHTLRGCCKTRMSNGFCALLIGCHACDVIVFFPRCLDVLLAPAVARPRGCTPPA